MREIVGKVTEARRGKNTVSGNAQWRLILNDTHVYTTAADAACANLVSPYDVGREVVLRLDDNGEVVFYGPTYPSRCETCGDLLSRCTGH